MGFADAIAKNQQKESMGMTVAEAARALGISQSAVVQALHAGRLIGVKFGGRVWAVNRQSVDSYRLRVVRRGPKGGSR